MTGQEANAPEQAHYFSGGASADEPFERERFTAQVWGRELVLASGPGVFSRGHLDHATGVLFREVPPPPPGRVLDLGCGYGVIGLAIARAWTDEGLAVASSRVIGVDVNPRALLLAHENAAALGVQDRFEALSPEEVPADVEFDEIWSNPPIRIGKQALHELLLTWLPRLAPGGRLVMVVGKNLGADSLQRWLIEQGWPTNRLASAKGFRVLGTTRADAG